MDDNQQLALREYVVNVLRSASHGSTTYEAFNSARATVLNIIHEGVAEVAGSWNTRCSAPLFRALPVEVLAQCFGHLKLRSRIRAACVCRRWRAIALSYPAIWSDLDAVVGSAAHLDLLRIIMLRSVKLPLDLQILIPPTYNEPELSSMLREQIHRIRSLSVIGNYRLDFGDTDACFLETADVADIVLPRAPLLRELRAETVDIQRADFRYTNLESFSGDIIGSQSAAFFRMCPNLERLKLVDLSSHRSIWPGPSAPSTLTHLKLVRSWTDNDDYLKTFHGCHALQDVELDFRCSFGSALNLFNGLGHTLHRMILDSRYAQLQAIHGPRFLTRIPDFFLGVHLDLPLNLPTLREVVVKADALKHLNSRRLPGAAVLEIGGLILEVSSFLLRDLSLCYGPLLNVPALHTLVLQYLDDARDDFYHERKALMFIKTVVDYLPTLLGRLYLSEVHDLVIICPEFDTSELDTVNLTALREYVDNFYHNDQRIDLRTPVPVRDS